MSGELTKIVEEFYRRFGAGDLDAAIQLFDPDVVSVSPGGTLRGAGAFKAYGEGFKAAFPDSEMRLKGSVEAGDTVAVEGVYAGTHTGTLVTPEGEIPATGKSIELPYCDVFRIADGRIVEHRVYWDQLTMMAQLGLMPSPASA